jgi:hypothetical protein
VIFRTPDDVDVDEDLDWHRAYSDEELIALQMEPPGVDRAYAEFVVSVIRGRHKGPGPVE